jgi:hypothetical protein
VGAARLKGGRIDRFRTDSRLATLWANDRRARNAFAGLSYSLHQDRQWFVTFASRKDYPA